MANWSYETKPQWGWAYNASLISSSNSGWVYANPFTNLNERIVAMRNFRQNAVTGDALSVDNGDALNVALDDTKQVFLKVDDPDAQ